jgi:hypothetical protein
LAFIRVVVVVFGRKGFSNRGKTTIDPQERDFVQNYPIGGWYLLGLEVHSEGTYLVQIPKIN